MVQRNKNIAKLQAGYLFPEIGRRRRAFLEQNPDARVISLGIGNTTEPLTPHIVAAMQAAVLGLGTPEGYSGYGDARLEPLQQRLGLGVIVIARVSLRRPQANDGGFHRFDDVRR